MMKKKASSTITVGQTTIELLCKNGQFLGLGRIAIKGATIRAATVPLRPDILTPDGIRYDSFRLDAVRKKGSETVLVTTAFGRQGLLGEYRDEYDSLLAWPRTDGGPFADIVEWRLKPETLTLDGVKYEGFSYALRFRSKQRSIHQITMVATWELGGHATGNTLLNQGQVNPPVYTCAKSTSFTTACWRTLGKVTRPEDYSFQFCSRYSPIQCFDFQYSAAGTLFGYWPDFVDVHSLVQKNPGDDVVFVLDKCLKPLAKDVAFPRKCILWAPPPAEGAKEHLMHDRWLKALDHAQGRVRAAFHIHTPYSVPETALLYRTSLDRKGKLVMWVAGKPCAPQDTLAAWAKHLPALAKAGVRRLFPEVMAESDVTENGYTYKLQGGIHGDLITSSVCNVWRYRMADFWGGWKAWEHFYRAGKKEGLEIGHWIGSHLSPNSPIVREHPEFIAQHANTRPHAGGYAINLCCGLNWDTACDWMLEQFAEWKRHGLDYIFFDSIGNYGLMAVDYKARMQPNAAGLARFIGGLNRMGVKAITVEGISPVGIGRSGMSDNMTEKARASDAVAGQNDWSWWVGHEDMLVNTAFMVQPHPTRTKQELKEQCFRATANGSLLMFQGHGEPPDQWPSNLSKVAEYYQTFNQVQPFMEHRRLLPNRQGVEWTGGKGRVLFAYAAFPYALPAGARVERVDGDSVVPETATGTLITKPYTAYRIARG